MIDDNVIKIIKNPSIYTVEQHRGTLMIVMNRIRDYKHRGIDLYNDYLLRNTLLFK